MNSDTWVVKRTTLGILVVCLDVAIVFSFLLSFYFLAHYEKLENKEINQNLLTTEDFAIVVKTLPEFEDYNSLKELKALLWSHLESVAETEPQ